MGFLSNFFHDIISRNMEKPEERDAHFRAHVVGKYAEANKLKEGWRQPTKPWGYWRSDYNNAKYWTNSDPAISKLPGRSQQGQLY